MLYIRYIYIRYIKLLPSHRIKGRIKVVSNKRYIILYIRLLSSAKLKGNILYIYMIISKPLSKSLKP